MILATILIGIGCGAAGLVLGKATGHRECADQIIEGFETSTQVFLRDKVIVGYSLPFTSWVKNETWNRAEADRCPPVETGEMSKSTSCELAYVETTLGVGVQAGAIVNDVRIDPVDLEHAREVQIVGINKVGFDHPFLSPVNAG